MLLRILGASVVAFNIISKTLANGMPENTLYFRLTLANVLNAAPVHYTNVKQPGLTLASLIWVPGPHLVVARDTIVIK